MNHDPLKVRCRFAVLVDHFTLTHDNKPVMIGGFDRVITKRQPDGRILFSSGFLVVRLECAIAAGADHSLRISLVDDSGGEISKWDTATTLRPGSEGLGLQGLLSMQLAAITVPAYGYYCWNVAVDGAVIAECPMLVQELGAMA